MDSTQSQAGKSRLDPDASTAYDCAAMKGDRSPMKQPLFPPMSREEMDRLGWEECDIILVTGDAYVDHPSFGSAVIARVLLDEGFRVGVIAQPRWESVDEFRQLGRPRLFLASPPGMWIRW